MTCNNCYHTYGTRAGFGLCSEQCEKEWVTNPDNPDVAMKNLNYLLERALHIAVEQHRGQYDKAGYPYIFHPLAVAEMCETREQKIVALLHDVLEDTTYTALELRKEFPEHIVLAVETLTRREGETYKEFIEKCAINSLAKYVKERDIRHNLSPDRLGNLAKEKRDYLFKKYNKALIDLESVKG